MSSSIEQPPLSSRSAEIAARASPAYDPAGIVMRTAVSSAARARLSALAERAPDFIARRSRRIPREKACDQHGGFYAQELALLAFVSANWLKIASAISSFVLTSSAPGASAACAIAEKPFITSLAPPRRWRSSPLRYLVSPGQSFVVIINLPSHRAAQAADFAGFASSLSHT